MSRRVAGLVAGTIGCMLALPACTDADTADPTPSPSATPPFRMPLAVVMHLSRAPHDLTLDQASAVASGQAEDWSDLGAESGPLRIVESVDAVAGDPSAVAVVPADDVTPRVRAATVDGENPVTAGEDFAFSRPSGTKPGTVVRTTITGDIMMGRRVGAYMQRIDDPSAVLRPFSKRLSAADITVGNLESTLSDDGAPQQGGDSFAAAPSTLAGLDLAGFDAVSLANNHFGDYQRRAMLDTLRRLDNAGIATFGGGRNLDEARAPAIVERHGVRFGFIGTDSIGETPAATSSSPGTNRIDAPPRTGPFDRDDLDRVADDVRALDDRVDIVIVIPHWGRQYTPEPEYSQRKMARGFIRAGADLVAGGHPHWVQGWETIGDATVVHSLGNFVFDMTTRQTREGLVLEVVSRGDRVVAVDTVPYVIGARDFTPRPTRNRDRIDAIYDLVRGASEPPFDQLGP